jgi:hypothetical protein
LEILVWDKQNETWTDEWDQDNAVPERIEISLYISSDDEDEEPIKFTRVLDIPVFDSMKDRLSDPSKMKTGNAMLRRYPARFIHNTVT